MPSKYAVVGEAPGANEDDAGRPFVGAAGQLLERELGRVGLNINDFAYLNVVSCRPRNNDDPPPWAVKACAGNLKLQLGIIDAEVVVLVGRFALQAFRSDATMAGQGGMTKGSRRTPPKWKPRGVHGRPFFLPRTAHEAGKGYAATIDLTGRSEERKSSGRVYYPMIHPAAAFRSTAMSEMLTSDVRGLARGIRSGWDQWPRDCDLCGADVAVYDWRGVPWCERHVPVETGEQMKLSRDG